MNETFPRLPTTHLSPEGPDTVQFYYEAFASVQEPWKQNLMP